MTDERIEGLIARAEAWFKQTAAIDKAPIDLVGDMLAQLRADHPAPSSLARQIMRGLERGAQRTPQDYAIEFGGYLADRAVTFLRLMEEPDMGADNPDHQAEVYRALRSAVYEFRKRAARCAPDVHIAVGPEAVDEALDTEHLTPEQQRVMDKALRRPCAIIDKSTLTAPDVVDRITGERNPVPLLRPACPNTVVPTVHFRFKAGRLQQLVEHPSGGWWRWWGTRIVCGAERRPAG